MKYILLIYGDPAAEALLNEEQMQQVHQAHTTKDTGHDNAYPGCARFTLSQLSVSGCPESASRICEVSGRRAEASIGFPQRPQAGAEGP